MTGKIINHHPVARLKTCSADYLTSVVLSHNDGLRCLREGPLGKFSNRIQSVKVTPFRMTNTQNTHRHNTQYLRPLDES